MTLIYYSIKNYGWVFMKQKKILSKINSKLYGKSNINCQIINFSKNIEKLKCRKHKENQGFTGKNKKNMKKF